MTLTSYTSVIKVACPLFPFIAVSCRGNVLTAGYWEAVMADFQQGMIALVGITIVSDRYFAKKK